MRALLLSAGFGSRLKPYTNKIPKCLMKIKGRELLDIWICSLVNFGIDKILINTHYKHELIQNFIENHKHREKIVISYEKKILNTAGTLYQNIDFFNKHECLFIHSDNLLNIKLKSFYKAHVNRPDNCFISMLCFKTNYPKECGVIKINKQKIITEYFEKQSEYNGRLANGAIYILSKKFLRTIKSNKKKFLYKNFTTDIIQNNINSIYTYYFSGDFNDIGTVKVYNKMK